MGVFISKCFRRYTIDVTITPHYTGPVTTSQVQSIIDTGSWDHMLSYVMWLMSSYDARVVWTKLISYNEIKVRIVYTGDFDTFFIQLREAFHRRTVTQSALHVHDYARMQIKRQQKCLHIKKL